VACSWDAEKKRARLIWHRVFQPSPKEPLDFEATIETSLLELRERFQVREIKYDPYQLVAVAQRLQRHGLPMVEFPQSVPNLTEASTNLYELIKARNLVVYPDADIRLSISRAVAIETSRGWRIAKEKQAHKIDVVVALAQAALGATQRGQHPDPVFVKYFQMKAAEARVKEGWSVEAAAGAVNLPVDALREWMKPRANSMIDRYNRRLASEGRSYSSILDAVRTDMVASFVEHGQRPLNEIAGLPGFSGLSAFSSWFRNRFGRSASEWRAVSLRDANRESTFRAQLS